MTLLTLLIKGIPEGLLDVLAIYIFTRSRFDKKNYLIISSIFIISTYLIRQLPINLGVTTMLSMLVLVVTFVSFKKIDLPKLIKSIIIMAITLIVCEEINIALIIAIFGNDKFQQLLNSTFELSIYSIPSTILFGITIFISYQVLKKIDKKKLAIKNLNDSIVE